jgi:hypothetical protein
MKFPFCIFLLLGAAFVAHADSVKSPDGQIEAKFSLNASGEPRYEILRGGRVVLPESKLGLVRDDADFSRDLAFAGESKVEAVEDRYELLTGKRRVNTYRANRRVFHLATKDGWKMDIVFQVSNDGVAFRYVFPETSVEPREIAKELTSFHFAPETKAWLQPMQVAKTGYEKSNPAYEEYYEKEIPVGAASPLGQGWVYPALFRTGDTWVLVSESALGRGACATHLGHESPGGEYSIAFPDPRETRNGESVNPRANLPWATPWRVVVVGSLKMIVESTLGTDVADPPAKPTDATVKPGKAAWSWPLLGDPSANFETQKKFIDYAADMGWAYVLIDAWWDRQIGYEKMKQLADYAAGKHVGILLWYNSAGDWNTVKQTPRDKLLTHESRVAEFAKLAAMGIKGLKIDFFGGDGRAMIDYYRDILEDAASYGLLLNFHGATLPRGWQRTYPHLMTAEAIRGEEYITFEQRSADQQPSHCAMLPFTRNVFDPMDFTPVVLDKLPNKKIRRTTPAFELALAVLFVSGIQHYAEIPEGLAKQPAYVKEFLKHMPSVWDDTRFLAGEPGKYVVLARKGDGRIFIAGINAQDREQTVTLDLAGLRVKGGGTLITDGKDEPFAQQMVKPGADGKLTLTMKPHGGFVMTVP